MRSPSPFLPLRQAMAPLFALACLGAGQTASAQRVPPGEVSSSFTLSAVNQRDADLDNGGTFGWNGAAVYAEVKRQFTPELSLGLSARLARENWSFGTPGAFGPVAPWTDVLRPSIGVNLGYALARDLSLFVSPQLEWAYESGARTSDAVSYGAVLGGVQVFSPSLVLGLGVGVFRQIDRSQIFPFPIVNWQITEGWRLSNPLRAGPAGGAGLELSYAVSDAWELATGAAFRDYRFRLNGSGPAPGGIGRSEGAPVFARLTRKFGPLAQLDLYAGAVAGGKLQLHDAAGATLQSTGYRAAPLLALSGSFSF